MKTANKTIVKYDKSEDRFVKCDYELIGETESHFVVKKIGGKREKKIHKSLYEKKIGFNFAVFFSDYEYFIVDFPFREIKTETFVNIFIDEKINKLS
jgi:hypothetical protein